MGKLVDPEFWRRTIDAVWNVQPVRGAVMSDDDIHAFLTVMCRSLEDLLSDHDYTNDLRAVEKMRHSVPENFPQNMPAGELRKFIDECVEFERALLLQSKFSESQCLQILEGIYDVRRYLTPSDFSGEELNKRIVTLKSLACEIRKVPVPPPMSWREVAEYGFDGTLGLVAIGVDASSIVTTVGFDAKGWISVAKGARDVWKATAALLKG